MGYIEVKDFRDGVDARRPAVVGPPASLQVGTNVVVTRGGDIESRKRFVPQGALPAGTFGLHSVRNKLYVFGSQAEPSNLPPNVVYQRLDLDGVVSMTKLLAAENFGGKIYAIAEYDDGTVAHWYGGDKVEEWGILSEQIATVETLASYLADKVENAGDFIATASGAKVTITASDPGTPFTVATSVSGTGGAISQTQLQANQTATAETLATGSFDVTDGFVETNNTIDSVTVDGAELLENAVPYTLDNAGTALAIATEINNSTTGGLDHGYTAEASGNTVTLTAPEGTGSAPNGDTVAVTTSNSFVTVGNIDDMTGGVDAVEAQAQIVEVSLDTFAFTASYVITLDGGDIAASGRSAGVGRTARTFKEKMHSGAGSLAHFSAVAEPKSWVDSSASSNPVTPDTGLGFFNVASHDQGAELITGLGIYQNRLAVFSPNVVQIWGIDPDPNNNQVLQVLQNTGTRSPRAVIGFGSADLIYPSRTGIRSLRARDQTNAAFVDDVGTRIDREVVEWMRDVGDAAVADAAGIVDPQDGRVWMAIGERIYVFSYFPGSEIAAWTRFEPGFVADHFAIINDRLYVRSGDTIYLYGGLDGNTYPSAGEAELEVTLPFIDADRVAGSKKLQGIDVVAEGEWALEILVNPNDQAQRTDTIRVVDVTTVDGRIAVHGQSSHFAPRLTSNVGGRLRLSSLVIHFDDTRAA